MKDVLSAECFLMADEMTMQVLSEPGEEASSKSHMWIYCTGEYDPGIYIYEYQPSRVYIVYSSNAPTRAKNIGKFALIGFIRGIVGWIMLTVIGVMGAASYD